MVYFFKKGDALFGFFKSRRNKHGEFVFRPVIGRIFVALLALGVVGWMSAAFAVMLFVKHARDFDGGSYADLVFYPWRKEAYQKAWGDEYIERGLELLKEGEVQQAIHLIRVGHIKSPTNLDARLVLADFFTLRGRRDLASNLLKGGLEYAGDDIEYLKTTFQVLLSNQDDLAVQEIAEAILGDKVILTRHTQITALAAATAHFHRGNYGEAEDLIINYNLSNNEEGRILLARIDWESGRRDSAISRLEALSEQFTDQDEVYTLLTHFYRELGDHTRAHKYAVMRQISDPLSPGPRISLIYSHHAVGESDLVNRQAELLLRDFGHDRRPLIQLAEFATHAGDVELVRRVFQTMDRGGFSLDLAAIFLAETYLNARQFREAINFLESYSRQSETFLERHASAIHGIRAVAYLSLGANDTGEIHLSQFMNARHLRAEAYLLTSRRILEFAGESHSAVARRVLMHAHRTDPLNQAALAELIRIDLEAGRTNDLVANIQKLLTTRKPSRALLQDSLARLGGDRFLFLPDRDALLRSLRELVGDDLSENVIHS